MAKPTISVHYLLYKSKKLSCLTFFAGQRSVVSCTSVKIVQTAEYRRRLDPQPGSDANHAHQNAAGKPYERVIDPEHLKAEHIMLDACENGTTALNYRHGLLHLSSPRIFEVVVVAEAVHLSW